VPFQERWARLDESVRVLRQLWADDLAHNDGPFYPLAGVAMDPRPSRPAGPPIWIGSWGSPAGLRRAARLGDGWMASAYNTSPSKFAEDWIRVRNAARQVGKDENRFGNAVVTMFSYVTDDATEADRVARTILEPALGRPAEDLMTAFLLGPAPDCAAKLSRFAQAGAQRVFIWPAADALRQLQLFAAEVVPLVQTKNPRRTGGH
jgi:alkanesulfonate monooxygenase SsuD/methylene tetrahydromethanopterin reductase-like flavin-dependent oxidoreductase (luciferase family)